MTQQDDMFDDDEAQDDSSPESGMPEASPAPETDETPDDATTQSPQQDQNQPDDAGVSLAAEALARLDELEKDVETDEEEKVQDEADINAIYAELTAAVLKMHDTDAQLKAMAEQVEALKRTVGAIPLSAPAINPRFQIFPAKAGSTALQWKEQSMSGGSLADMPGSFARVCTSDSDPSALVTPDSDTFFILQMVDVASGAIVGRALKIAAGGGGTFLYPVLLTKDGGVLGNSTTKCTATYTMKDITNTTTLGAGASPSCDRSALGLYVAATYGMAYNDADGTPILFYAHEVPVNGCGTLCA